mmetsp:Transcript_8417/g.21012  ORF Transcript_8417/g.21012 Transcript_8417/m.21012 type:complete len:94 (+) Transcript_8417:176-457(+)
MGVDIKVTRDPDMNRTIKKIVKFQPPCATELMSLMDCFKKYAGGGEADTACAKQRQALAACTRTARPASVSAQKTNFVRHLKTLARAWRRSGY